MSGANGSDYQRRNEDLDEQQMIGDEIYEAAVSENGGNGAGGELKDMDNFVAGQGEETKNEGALGLEPETNPQANQVMQNNGDIPFPSYIPSQSPQHSPESGVDSVSSSIIPLETNRASDLLMAVSLCAEQNKTKISDLANSAMEELIRKGFGGEPLWQRQVDSKIETLNEAEYIREFRAFDVTLKELMRMIEVGDPQCFATLDGSCYFANTSKHKPTLPREAELDTLQTEASRDIGFVNVNVSTVIEWLMDLKQWSLAFSKIVSRATILGVLSTGMAGSCDETLQVMSAEFHLPTPLVPIRECQFARYCKRVGSKTWGVVDVSLENVFPYPVVRFRRRPSGCLIQEMPNGHSKVTWVEHVEVDNSLVRRIFQPLVLSGFAFGASRWVATLVQHSELLATLMSQKVPANIHGGLIISQNGKESLLRLTERMMRSFCVDISASSNNFWMPLPVSEAEDFRVMTKSITTTPGCPVTTIAFTFSLLLPAPPRQVFDFLRHYDSRNKWDLLSRELIVEELTHIIMGGDDQENRISILQAKSDTNRKEILYLQESYSDPTAYYVVYAPMDIVSMATVLNGGNPDYVNILPSGFVIHPYNRPDMNNNEEEVGGSILTLGFHIVDGSSTKDSMYITRESVDTVYRILTQTAILIKAGLLSENGGGGDDEEEVEEKDQ